MLLALQQQVTLLKHLQRLLHSLKTVEHAMLGKLQLQGGKPQENHSLQMIGSWNLQLRVDW